MNEGGKGAVRRQIAKSRVAEVHTCEKSVCGLRAALNIAVAALEHAYTVKLPRFELRTGLSFSAAILRVKEWMSRAQKCEATRRRGRKERLGLRLSISLTKKIFPEPCKCVQKSSWEQFKSKQGIEERETVPAFIAFVIKETRKMFPIGWDKTEYIRSIESCPISGGACVEKSRAQGGLRSSLSHDAFLKALETGVQLEHSPFKFLDVLSSGKMRSVTVQPSSMAVLAPLHRAIYSRISRFKWLLRGSPCARSFSRAGFVFQNGLLSGDYAGATDSLDLRVSRTILSTILDSAGEVPDGTKKSAMASLDIWVEKGDCFRVMKGQMMGSFLSFPLLCLYNRLASKFALGDVPMIINGDDIVAETSQPERWFSLLPSLGLQPERSKTDYKRSTANINSTAFIIKDGVAVKAPTIRVRSLVPDPDMDVSSIGARLHEFIKDGPSRIRAAGTWLKSYGKFIHTSLSCGVPLRRFGFWEEDLDILRLHGIASRAIKFSRVFYQSCPPPPSRLTPQEGLLMIPDRISSTFLNDAMSFHRFCNGSPIQEYEKDASILASKAAWKQMRDFKSVASKPLTLAWGLAGMLRLCRRTNPACFGEPLPSQVYINRNISKTPNYRPVPIWAWDTLPTSERRQLLALRWTQADDPSRS